MKRINAVGATMAGALCLGIGVLIILGVLSRIFGHPIDGVIEIVGFSVVAIVSLGVSEAEEAKAHIRVDALIVLLPQNYRRAADLLAYLVAASVFVLITWQTGVEALRSWSILEIYPGIMYLPVYPAKSVVVLGSGLLCIQFLLNVREMFTKPQ